MKAKFVTTMNSWEVDDVEAYAEKHFYRVHGRSHDWSKWRNEGGVVPREELDNQPLFVGFLSPMWDGDGLRYETQEVYNQFD